MYKFKNSYKRAIAVIGLFCLGFVSTASAQSFVNSTVGNINDATLCPGATGTGTTANLDRTFNVTGIAGTVTDINVGLLATHTWRGDMEVRLISPSGLNLILINPDTSGSGNDDDYNLELGDEAPVTVNTGAADGPHDVALTPYQVLASPNNALSAFNGTTANGTWTLRICDDYAGETGQFQQATLFFANPTDADLSLTSSISNTLPQDGDTITLTYNLLNAGPSTTSGVTVGIDLPPFLDFVSSTGTGSYSDVTEVWTIPGTVPVGTTTITLTANVNSVGSGSMISEVLTSAENDPDSTPGNSVSAEDDYDNSGSIFVQPPPTPPSLSCPAVDQFVHAWTAPGTTNGWTAGDLTDSYTAGGIPLLFTVTGNTGNLGQISGVDAPVTQDDYTGGIVPAEHSLGFAADHSNSAQELVLTVDLDDGTGVQGLQFSVFDIDLGGWVDRLTVTGDLNGTTVFPTLTPSARNFISGNSAIGQGGNAGLTEASGNVVVTFNSPIDQVTIAYGNDPSAGANPAFQIMSVHEMTMCPRLLADLTAVKSVEVYDPGNAGLYMTPGNEVLYKITVNNSATANSDATDIDLSDTLPDNVRFISAATTGFTGGAFGTPALPAANTDCVGGACVVRYSGATLPINTTGEIQIRALIK
ncbi:MAG: proprotein convertase P-domain-containing protein [Hellea sp.]